MANILEMKHISKRFPGVLALDDVSISVEKGSVHAVMGENGAGKSTLMNVLSGIYEADGGEILFDGKPVRIRSTSDAIRLGISMIHQELNPFMDLTVAENIFMGRFPMKGGRIDWKECYRRCAELLKRLGMSYDPKAQVRSLSMADMQMLEIAKAISFDARLIVMDEPTSAITENEVDKLFEFIRRLKKQGMSIILITHKINEVFRIADIVSVLRDGKYIGTRLIGELDRDTLVTMMVGREIKNVYVKTEHRIGEPILRVENLNRGKKVRDVSFELRKGEILGFSGVMGAGRTETMRCIFGLDRPRSGRILYQGQEVRIRHSSDAIKKGIMMTTEDRKNDGLMLGASIYDNLVLPSTPRNSRRFLLDKKRERPLMEGISKQLTIKAPSMKTLANQLSGGNQQKVILAKWLLMQPAVLILDEPTRGIDVGAKAEIYSLMSGLTAKGVSIIMVSSDMEEIVGMSDRVAVMSGGKVRGILEGGKITQENIMSLAAVES